jgi:hypothetical protein
MNILEQPKTALKRALGIDRLRTERDRYRGERDIALRERDSAIGERNQYLIQLQAVQRACFGATGFALRALAQRINEAVGEPSSKFFSTVDGARMAFRDATLTTAEFDVLGHALLGVKLINLLTAKHEYLRGAIATTARPMGFMLDPANQCHLGCPSCSNSFNREHVERTFNPWPRGLMTEATFDTFLREVGLYAFAGHMYNNHEPFLNKLTPAFVRKASDLRMHTFISSNFSYRRIDAEAIVASGLTELMLAVDGATQAVYERYRRGGRLEWVLDNARAIVAAKAKLNSPTPILRWQFLTFEHNLHEVDAAIELAKGIGFDSFSLATPNSVSQDDPSIHTAEYPGERYLTFRARPQLPLATNLSAYRDLIESALSESAMERWQRYERNQPATVSDSGTRCDWLHLAVISDAMGRIVPCCNGDYKDHGRFVLAQIDSANGNIMNSADYREARHVVVDPGSAGASGVICARCPARPRPQIGLGAVGMYMADVPPLASGDMAYLHNWSRHSDLPR